MISKNRVKKIAGKLNFSKTFKLVWSISPVLTSVSLLLILAENACFLLSAYFFKNLINIISQHAVTTPEKTLQVERYLTADFIFIILYVIIRAISSYIGELQGAKVNESVDGKIHESAVALDLAFYESPEYFDTLKRAREAGADRPVSIVNTMIEVIKNVSMVITLCYVVATISWVLIPIIISIILPAFFVRLRLARNLHDRRLAQTHAERYTSYISSLIIGDSTAKEIRGYGLGTYFKNNYLSIRLKLLSERLAISRRGLTNSLITDLFATTVFFGCIAYICYQATQGKIGAGEITLFLVLFPQIFSTLQNVSGGFNKLYQDNIYLIDLFKLFDLKPILVEPTNPLPVPDADDLTLEVENVDFSYPHSKSQVLSGVNLKIPSGKLVAVVGLNGAGKTTLIKLLCRLYDPTSGIIKIGGIDIRKFKSTAYRKCLGTVFQDFVKYNVSVADNIRYGDIDGEREPQDIVKAAENSGANVYIEKFPDKYDTIMGRIFDNGHEISIGQWQKLAIARALYSRSKFIILDEATSALDAKAEMELFDSLKASIGTRGALVISHRLSAVQHADYIYVMSDGCVAQEGTHDELIAMPGDYANLFKKHSKRQQV